MIKVKIICLGKLKEKYLKDASIEYEKRLSRFCDFQIIELSPCSLPENPSKSQIDSALEQEANEIEKRIPKNSHITALCVEGVSKSSEELSITISSLINSGRNFVFIIGSSYGLSERIKQISDLKLSLSKMTFPHQLFRIMLEEQIYRSFKIIEGSTYHK